MLELPDIHSTPPRIKIEVDAVGVRDIVRPVEIEGLATAAFVRIDGSVRVPPDNRGAHVSRIPLAVDEAVDAATGPISGTRLIGQILDAVQRLNPEAGACSVQMSVDAVIERGNHHGDGYPTMKKPCRLLFSGRRGEADELEIGAEIKVGMACPQAQASLSATQRESLEGFLDKESVDLVYESIAVPSHNQLCDVRMVLRGSGAAISEVRPLELISTIEASCSSPTFEYLKRREEGLAVNDMHQQTMFAEDAARDMAFAVATKYAALPDDTRVVVSILSYESIYDYPLTCELEHSLGALRQSSAEL